MNRTRRARSGGLSPNVMTKDAGDRYLEDVATAEHVAEFRPHAQVGVCQPCNNGWMSRMERPCGTSWTP